jgi:Holliday junction resolvase RusA-like endonuclease
LLSKAARDYALKVQNALPTGRVEPLRGRLHVTMRLYPPTKLKQASDIANREKCLFDCLTKQRIWLDDSQIDALYILRGLPGGEGAVHLRIQEFDNPPNES